MTKIVNVMSFLPPASKYYNGKSRVETTYRIYQPDNTPDSHPVLVFLHGFNGSSKSWAYQFSHFVGHTIIAVDAPGFGGSQTFEGDMSAVADETAELIKSLVDKKVVIIGHSMGGMLGQVLAAKHANLCSALILSCTHKGRAQPKDTPLDVATMERIQQRNVLDDKEYGELRVGKMLKGVIAPDIFKFLTIVAGEIRVGGIRSGGLNMLNLDTTNLLSEISIPTAIFTAENDIVVSLEAAAALKAALPNAYKIQLSDVGHAPYCENATSFNAAIEKFIGTI